MLKNFAKISAFVGATLCAGAAFAAPIMSNGDMSYGDGGWYLWNNPSGPAVVESQIGVMGLGVEGSEVPRWW